jgi:hypothetical protein
MAGFVCIYCRQRAPAVAPSEAHIFPYVLGGSVATRDTVCRDCNQSVNKVVEMPALASVLALQSLFGIRGRRDQIRRVQGVLKTTGGEETTVWLNERGELTDAVVIERTDDAGKRQFSILGPSILVEAKMKEIAEANPDLRWEEKPLHEEPKVDVVFASSETLDLLRRLAAKVALERFAQLRSAEFVVTFEYDHVRTFILDGNDQDRCAGILADPQIAVLLKPFNPPHHVVYVMAHPGTRILGAFVIFYGLFYFWVILSRRFRALGATDDLLIQDPQAREIQNPRLRAVPGEVLPNWHRITAPYIRDPVGTSRAAGRHAIQIFQAAADAFYGPRG